MWQWTSARAEAIKSLAPVLIVTLAVLWPGLLVVRARQAPTSATQPPQAAAPTAAGYEQLSPAQLKQKMDAGEDFTLLDVRAPTAYGAGHLPGAISMPLQQLEWRCAQLDRQKETIGYCQQGVSSLVACRVLVNHGFADVKNLTGGIDAWPYEVVPGHGTVL